MKYIYTATFIPFDIGAQSGHAKKPVIAKEGRGFKPPAFKTHVAKKQGVCCKITTFYNKLHDIVNVMN